MRKLAMLLLCTTTLVAIAPPLRAQFAGTADDKEAAKAEAADQAKQAEAAKAAAASAPPPAIPGAQASPDTVAPADKLAAEMSPNDALFDAIDRGDVSAARDAMNRGAELDAKNVLGQSPIDVAIDLNRNDITFLLLSLRGAVGGGANPRPQQAMAQAAPSAKPGKPGKLAVTKLAARQAAAPTLLAADRGTPDPSVGFTGF